MNKLNTRFALFSVKSGGRTVTANENKSNGGRILLSDLLVETSRTKTIIRLEYTIRINRSFSLFDSFFVAIMIRTDVTMETRKHIMTIDKVITITVNAVVDMVTIKVDQLIETHDLERNI